MKTLLEQICDEVAKENDYQDWIDLCSMEITDTYWPEVCRRYGIEVGKATLLKASENVSVNYNRKGVFLSVNSLSITDEDNIVLP